MLSDKEQTCTQCVRPNCNGQNHLTEDAYLGCSQCGIELNDIIELLENVSIRNTEQCEICGHNYSDVESSNEHFLDHFYDQPAKVFMCIDCESNEPTDVYPDEPVICEETAPKKRKLDFNCDMCEDGASFTSARGLTKHKQEVHGCMVKTEFNCRDCDKVFDTSNKLSYHRLKKHPKQSVGQIDTFQCRICETEIFGTKPERNQHENEIHRDPETNHYPCPFCEKTYPNVSFLANHLLKHTKKRTHTCEICGKSFGRMCHLDYHRSTHTDQKLFECALCEGKSFKTAHSLNHHVARMHTERPGYPCDLCDRVFKDTSDRRRHRWSHGGITKRFACELCPKKFYEQRAVRFHMKVHNKAMLAVSDGSSDDSKSKESKLEL